MTEEIAAYEGHDLTISKPPEKVLEEARRAAKALRDVVSQKPKPVIINNERTEGGVKERRREMTEEIAVYEETKIVDAKTIKDFLFTSGTKLAERQQVMFMQLAIRNQLDPFKREIYAIPYGEDFNIVTGYQTYIKRAEATGKLDGWECIAMRDEKGNLKGAKITIYRKDFSQPFIWEVSLAEFDKGQSSWKKMPEFMIKKVCIGQGFRLAFPNELGGLPYLQEELEGLVPENSKPPIHPPKAKTEETEEKKEEKKIVIKDPESPATENQLKAIYTMLDKLGIKDDYEKHSHVSDILELSYVIESIKDINKGQAGEVIGQLSQELGK